MFTMCKIFPANAVYAVNGQIMKVISSNGNIVNRPYFKLER